MPPNSRISSLHWPRIWMGYFCWLLDSRLFIPGCFILFVGLRAALIFFVPVEMGSDARWYFSRGLGIANGDGYSEGGYPTAYWPVGYPGFLGILFFFFWSKPACWAGSQFAHGSSHFFFATGSDAANLP